jgi:hypothetical protein
LPTWRNSAAATKSSNATAQPAGSAIEPGQTTTHRTWEPVLRADEIAQLDTARGHALILAEDLPPILARQPALHENKVLWAVIQAETRGLAPPAATEPVARERRAAAGRPLASPDRGIDLHAAVGRFRRRRGRAPRRRTGR